MKNELSNRMSDLHARTFDIERMLADCVPGGCSVDPQHVADSIRGWFAEHDAAAQDSKVKLADSLVNDVDDGEQARDAARWRAIRAYFIGTVFDKTGNGISEFQCLIPQCKYCGCPDAIADAAVDAVAKSAEG